MTFGGVHTHLKGDARISMQSNKVGIIDPPKVYSSATSDVREKDNKNDTYEVTTILTLPKCSTLIYTTTQFLLICSIVGALWTMAIGLWSIKHYVECNQGVTEC